MMPPGFNLLRFKFPTVLAVGILVVIYSFQQGHWLSGPLLNMYYYGSSFPRTTDLQNEFSWADVRGLYHFCDVQLTEMIHSSHQVKDLSGMNVILSVNVLVLW